MAAHALLSASKANQWLNCPPSARLQENMPDKQSDYADEGTIAHALAENRLRRQLFPCDSTARKQLDDELAIIQASKWYGKEMESAIQDYVDLVAEHYLEAKVKTPDAVLLLEERLDFSEWVPAGFGTGDAIIIADQLLEVIDLKYGQGTPVSAVGNPQTRLYGLGAWNEYDVLYGIQGLQLTIIQPRLGSVTTESMTAEELLAWAETIVRPAAELAAAGEGEFKAGDHCKWCKVKGNCRARADENMKALEYEFQEPALLTHEEIGTILFIAQQLREWVKDVEDYAYEQALRGEKIPQWKLVEGRSNRVITDKEKAQELIKAAGYAEETYLKKDLYGIGELEKRLGKKELTATLGNLLVKPEGKPVLVPETDNRPGLNSMEKDFENIEMED